ncbi:unnamed protein product [Didymodactylos carnosus]|uniref:HAT C-terminal dimerisation domain-containing protein n=1 Tax=Didymodactylos carnosus TaxID=1234261 RepID=A0A8S2TZG5_9BILA|nr:unnamed protein product [Didymodactylos carnosus]CAF4312598.1 unnamed protein product [Didymodactylos carnosus]
MDLRRSATEACVKFCSYDMRPFDIMNGHGFQTLCQALLDAGHSQSHRIIALDILPDCTTIARSVNSLADKKRLEFIEMLKVDLKNAELFGITCDYWKNKYSCESYLTINMHYGKNGQIQNVMLKTMLFTASKTAENTWNAILATLNSYGIDSDKCHIIFITDSGANLVKAFKGEAHLRCVSHCINLTAQQAIESVPEIHQLQNECRTLVTHFKRCELQHLLDTTLKHDLEDILLNRNEEHFLDNIDHTLAKEVADLLSTFKIGSEVLSADDTPTLHLVLPFFKKFKQCCVTRNSEKLSTTKLKGILLQKLDEKIWLSGIHYICSFLHPETKSLSSFTQSERNAVVASVRKMIKTLGIDQEALSAPTTATTPTHKRNPNKRAKRDKLNVDDILREFGSKDASSTHDEDDEPYDGINEYIKTKFIYPKGGNILTWWKDRSIIYKQLSRLALSLLAIPASSATAERIFSETGRILEPRRQL